MRTGERAPERPAEESRLRAQVGPGGWLPRSNSREMRRSASSLRKKGGTASVDAARPFAGSHPRGALRLVVDESRKGATMTDPSIRRLHDSIQTHGRSCPAQSNLRSSTACSDQCRTQSLSLAGPPRRLKTFTVSTRLRGRSLVEDTDLTRTRSLELLETAARLKRMHRGASRIPIWPARRSG